MSGSGRGGGGANNVTITFIIYTNTVTSKLYTGMIIVFIIPIVPLEKVLYCLTVIIVVARDPIFEVSEIG